ncbi:MAG: GLUG motif-containing protein [Alphaproteobacteria bacterium]
MFGETAAGVIRDLYLTEADIHSEGRPLVGALVGWSRGQIINASSDGKVSGASEGAKVGGLVGRNDGSIERSYSAATVTSHNTAGGVVGENGGAITQSYASGIVDAAGTAGGLVGYHGGQVSNSYAIARFLEVWQPGDLPAISVGS